MTDPEKASHDREPLGEKPEITHKEAIHHGKLTPDELNIERELRKKIDWRIMPLVILVYLMNYIDRQVSSSLLKSLN